MASLISWIDREWDDDLRARFTLPLIVMAVWVPLSLIGFNRITVSLAVIWAVPWVAVFFWRFAVWLQRFERREPRNRKRRGR